MHLQCTTPNISEEQDVSNKVSLGRLLFNPMFSLLFFKYNVGKFSCLPKSAYDALRTNGQGYLNVSVLFRFWGENPARDVAGR